MVPLILDLNVHCESYLYYWVLVDVVNWGKVGSAFRAFGPAAAVPEY